MVSLDQIARRLDVDLVAEQAQLYSSAALVEAMGRTPWQRGLVTADPARPSLILGVTAETVDSVGRFLVDSYGTAADLHLLDTAVDDEPPMSADLGQLRSLVLGSSEAAVWVAAGDPYLAARSADTLVRIIARLRAPDGCPWDREQTSQSLRDDIAGEAYEVMDAVDNGDDRNLAEELGDVLMAVALQAQIAEDEGRFTLADVYEAVNAKLVRRHPHVFGDTEVSGTDDIVANWNRIKAIEKASIGVMPSDTAAPLARYPSAMPALAVVSRLVARGQWPLHADTHPLATADEAERAAHEAERAADWYASRLVSDGDPEVELRAAVRRRIAVDQSHRPEAFDLEQTKDDAEVKDRYGAGPKPGRS